MKKEFRTDKKLKDRTVLAVVLGTIVGVIFLSWGIYSGFQNGFDFKTILFVIVGLLQLAWAWITIAIINTVRLVLTPTKLEYYSPDLALTTSWENLECIGEMPVRKKSTFYDSLVLRSPADQKCAWWFRMIRKEPEREIPLSMFTNWKKSDLGREIRKYAPQLFVNSAENK